MAVLLLLLQAGPARAGGWEVWTSATAEGPLTPRLDLRVTEEMRFNSGDLYYYFTDVGVNWKANATFDTAGVGCRIINLQRNTSWIPQDRLYVYGTANWKLGSVAVDDRSMVEYQFQSFADGRWRYRNRLTFSLPLSGRTDPPRLYVSDEMFFNISTVRVIRNRADFGLTGPVAPNLYADLFVQTQWTRKNDPDEGERKESLDALGARLKYRF